MSKIDDELSQAVAESESASPTAPKPGESGWVGATGEPTPGTPKKPNRNLGLLIALLVMGGGILTLVFTSFDQAAVYSKTVDQLVAQKDKLAGRNVNVNGVLVKGTLKKRDDPCEFRFTLQKNGVTLPVRYSQCIVPDTFQDLPYMDVDVTATGKLAEAGHFEASAIMAKCPSKYEMKAQSHGTPPNALGMPAAAQR
jgi:cytochrome c-type biogenesis protein CcmE